MQSAIITAILAIIQDFFIKKTGQKMTPEKMKEFIHDNCIDSNGNFKMLDVEEFEKIDFKKYI